MNLLRSHPNCALILSANLGSFDPEIPWAKQRKWDNGMPFAVCRLNDACFPPRSKAMTSRMQPGLIKMFGWQFFPGFDFYIWVDGSKTITSPDFGAFMMDALGKADMAIFKHPQRGTIKEEYEFVKEKMAAGNQYLLSRYDGEWLDEQYRAIASDRLFKDECLYASTGFVYRPNARIKQAFKEWWYHKTRYLLHDQLALPYALARAKVKVNVIDASIYKFPLWEHTRPRR